MRSLRTIVEQLAPVHSYRPGGSAFLVVSAMGRHRCRAHAEVSMAMRRVVVTGLGVVAPNGIGKEAFWSACKEGRSGVRPIRSFDPSGHPVKIAAEVPEFDVALYIPTEQRKSLKIMSRAMRFGVVAASQAWRDSGLD